MKVILTHPCAGKTYYARKDSRVTDCTDINKYVTGELVFVCVGHKRYRKYDAAVVLGEYEIIKNIVRRRQEGRKRYWMNYDEIMKERNDVIRIAREQGLCIYNSIPECVENEKSDSNNNY